MNKELEETKHKLEKIIERFYELPDPQSILINDNEVQAIETVLKLLESSKEEINYYKFINLKQNKKFKTYKLCVRKLNDIEDEYIIETDNIFEDVGRIMLYSNEIIINIDIKELKGDDI